MAGINRFADGIRSLLRAAPDMRPRLQPFLDDPNLLRTLPPNVRTAIESGDPQAIEEAMRIAGKGPAPNYTVPQGPSGPAQLVPSDPVVVDGTMIPAEPRGLSVPGQTPDSALRGELVPSGGTGPGVPVDGPGGGPRGIGRPLPPQPSSGVLDDALATGLSVAAIDGMIPDVGPEDLSDGLSGAPQDDIAPEPMAGSPSRAAVYSNAPPQQPPPAVEQEESPPPATNWDRFGNPVYNEDPTPEPEGGWQPRPAGAGFGNYAAGMDQQLGNVQERTLKILLDAGIEPGRAAKIVRGQLSMTEMERQAVIDNGGLQQQRAQSGIRSRRDARMGLPQGSPAGMSQPPAGQQGSTLTSRPESRLPYGNDSVDLGEATSERQGADESDAEYRFRMGTGMNANRRELARIKSGGLPDSYDAGQLGEGERLPGASGAAPRQFSNPNTFDPLQDSDPRQAFYDLERAEANRRRGQGVNVGAQRERDFASGQLGDFEERMAAQSRFAQAAQFDPNGEFGPNDFQRRYNPQATAEWNQRMQEKIRQGARKSDVTGKQYNSAEEKIAAEQEERAKDPEYQKRAQMAELRKRAVLDAKALGMTYEQVVESYDEYAALRGDSARNAAFAGKRVANLNSRDSEQALRRERLATRHLLGVSQPQANAFLMLSPNQQQEILQGHLTNQNALKIREQELALEQERIRAQATVDAANGSRDATNRQLDQAERGNNPVIAGEKDVRGGQLTTPQAIAFLEAEAAQFDTSWVGVSEDNVTAFAEHLEDKYGLEPRDARRAAGIGMRSRSWFGTSSANGGNGGAW